MQRRERAVRVRMDAGEKEVSADVEALRRDKIGWMEQVVVNVYVLPLLSTSSRANTCAAGTPRLPFTGHYPPAHGQTRQVPFASIRHSTDAYFHAAGLDRSIRHDRVPRRDPREMANDVSLDIDIDTT